MTKSTKKSGIVSTMILLLVLGIGLSLLLYPSFSSAWNQRHSTQVIEGYSDRVATLDTEKYEQIWQGAVAYNQTLVGKTDVWMLTEEEYAVYEQLLIPEGEAIIGYIEIPSINVLLPIYHGTEDAVLQVGVGHVEWSSLPTGGESTHCVLSGHRGLPSARLFTDLDQIREGDVFMLHVLDETLTYAVDQIRIVEPTDTDSLLIQEGKDLCSLVTCTPYGINTHRLLVRGHRVENAQEVVTVRVTADAIQVEPMIVACVLVVPFLIILFTCLLIFDSVRRNKKN